MTNTEKSNAATIKLSVSKDFNHVLWKEHIYSTDKTEHRIELTKIVSIGVDVRARPGGDGSGFNAAAARSSLLLLLLWARLSAPTSAATSTAASRLWRIGAVLQLWNRLGNFEEKLLL